MYGLVAFLGAFTLFFIQPFLGKALTPSFGGGAQVWIACMLFFQSTLLLGYAYAHGLVRIFAPRTQAWVHGALLVLVAALLSFKGFRHGNPLLPLPEDLLGRITPLHVLTTLTKTAALPLVALSATSPLTQAWYGRIFRDRVPYRLYALSNAGSLAGLLAYPLLAERWLATGRQGWWIFTAILVFSAGMVTLGSRIAGLEVLTPSSAPDPVVDGHGPERPWLWLLASASGSILLMATTNVLSTDVATIPLLWVLPLSLYLLSFILVFENRWPGSISWKQIQWLLPLALLLFVLARGQKSQNFTVMMIACGGIVFFGAMICHGYLYQLKPGSKGLTKFYLIIALGGSLGGGVVALLAPLLIDRLYEFGFGVMLVGVCSLLWRDTVSGRRLVAMRWLAALLCMGMGAWNIQGRAQEGGISSRNFFGTIRLVHVSHYAALNHGRIMHGAMDLEHPKVPLTYYGVDSGIGRVLELQGSRKPALRVGVVGLGLGSVAAYGRPGDVFRFYEINPAIIALGNSSREGWSFLRGSPARVEMVEGDARIELEQERARGEVQRFDVLLVDAFSSDCVPWHLLTEEAFTCYLTHLAPGGILILHVSNFVRVDRIALTSAKAHDLYGACLFSSAEYPKRGSRDLFLRDNEYVVLAREQSVLQSPLILDTALIGFGPKTYRGLTEASRRLPLLPGGEPWRDDKNSLSDLLFTGSR